MCEHAAHACADPGVRPAGDPGHAAARRVYQQAGYTLLPVARYFKAI
jgi:hypothetical protein